MTPFCLFKQKTAYDMRISDWSSDVCSSDLADPRTGKGGGPGVHRDIHAPAGEQYIPAIAAEQKPIRMLGADDRSPATGQPALRKIGRAYCRDRVCQYV